MVLVSRGRGGTGRFLQWKIRLFFVAAVILLVGMAREMDLLVLLAITLLAVAFVLRFFEGEAKVEGEETAEVAEED
jgi:membrane protein implicated in regulation of membrane protease activity